LKSGQANIALKTTGALFTWGFADKGSLGINESGNKSAPTQVGALTSWSKVFAGRLQNGAIKNDGTLWIWGTSAYGRLGNNVAGFSDANSRSSPIQIGADTNWSTLALSTQHNIAIRTTGTIWGWGVNSAGKIGLNRGSSLDYVSSPTQIGTETNWSKVVCGAQHTLAIKSDNTLWAWGSNGFGELGDNTAMYTPRLNKSSPVQVGGAEWQDVFLSTGAYHSVGIKTNGTLWAWGKNTDGRLGNNTTIDRSSPTQIGSLTTWSKATTGQGTIAALKTDGTMWIWGQAFFSHGVFGDNVGHASAVNRSSPAQIGSDTDWRVISMGDWSAALAVKAI
jgi:alpha-tubulin suppressor-like RCC1 family protein